MKNQLYYGDNLEIMHKYIADESVDLCYIDPPFNSKRNYNQIYLNTGKETAQVQAFVDTWSWNLAADKGFSDIIENKSGLMTRQSVNLILMLEKVLGKGSMLAYLVSMTNRIAEIYRVLKPTGSFYLHCDPTMSHYLKLVLDGLFVSRGGKMRNEIIWYYKNASRGKKQLAKSHDVIFCYIKSKNYNFYKDAILVPFESGMTDWRYSKGGQSGGEKPEGKVPDDVIIMPSLNTMAKERLGYATQKPAALLEQIIKASSNEGDVVLDAFCGCGTTVAVAEKLNRKWIGIDISYQAVSLILKRLEDTFGKDFTETTSKASEIKNNISIKGVPQDMASAIELANRKDDRLRKEFEKWAILTYSNNRAMINEKAGGDGGIDGIAFISEYDSNYNLIQKEVLFSVKSSKNLSPSVVRDLAGVVDREGAVAGVLITLYPMQNLEKEASRYGIYTHKLSGQEIQKIQIIAIEEMLNGARIKLPMASDVLKTAEKKHRNKQGKLYV